VTSAVAQEREPSELSVSSCMSTDLVTVDPDASFMEAAERMAERRIHHLLVCEDDQFVGMVHLDVQWSELGGLEAPIATFTAPI
jgi:signal-transduction protein with cAMP-binding, CBS, and nucleotidyltransferase domain